MRPARTARLTASILLAVAAIGGAAAGIAALANSGVARIGPVAVLELAPGYDKPAVRIVNQAHLSAADMATVDRLSRAALRQAPYDLGALMRLAFISVTSDGHLTPNGVAYLSRSYDLYELSPVVGAFRVMIGLNYFRDLPAPLRAHVRAEAVALASVDREEPGLEAATKLVRNPGGRILGALWIADGRMQAAQRQALSAVVRPAS